MSLDDWLGAEFPADSVEGCYRLSPVQEGMLLHVLRDPSAAMFFQQLVMPFSNLEADKFIKAWELVVARHSILRTSFHWEGVDLPIQVVHKNVALPVEHLDWSHVQQNQRERRLGELLREDRRRGFELSEAPLLRLTLINWGGGEYALVKSHHHLLLDGWSAPLMLGDVQDIYRTLLQGNRPHLQPAPQFRAYIDWLEKQSFDEAELFWRERLSGFRVPTPLPGATKVEAPFPPFVGEHIRIPAARFNEMRTLAQSLRVTPGTLVEAAWALLLSLWSDEEDVVFGATFSGRSSGFDGIESIVGMFINALPVRVTINGGQRFEDWVKEINERHFETQAYDFSPPGEVQNWSELPRGVGLFETLLTYNSQAIAGGPGGGKQPAAGGANQSRKRGSISPTNNALSLMANESGDDLVLELTGEGKYYTPPALVRLLEQLRLLLDAFVTNPKSEIGKISLMTQQDWQLVIHDWNQTDVDYPREKLLHQVFEESAERLPHASAVLFGKSIATFSEVNERANQLAYYLQECGVSPGILVGLSVARSVDMAVAVLAVLKTGGAYVPLDPDYPQDRLALLIQDSGLTVLLTESTIAASLPGSEARVVCIDSDQRLWHDKKTDNLQLNLDPETLALVIYTSGSTGLPKGVALPHRVLVNRIYTDSDPLGSDEVLCAKTSLNFIDSIWELFFPWAYGRPTLLMTKAIIQDPEQLISAIGEANVSRMVLVPSLLRSMLDSDVSLENLSSLKHLICSGEPLPGDLVQLFHKQLPGRVLTNLYGTSETWDVTRSDTRGHPKGEALHIGRPMGNCQAYVLDRNQKPVPVGMPGELCVGGEGLANGYYQQAELTRASFLPNPFSKNPDDRIYRTGDKVRWRTDGQIEFLGRMDFQLKIRGFRIEPGEVEAVLRHHAMIRNLAVAASSKQQLIAYIVFEEGDAPSNAELREFSAAHLPGHLVPALFVRLPELPLTPSGKIDRRSLPEPDSDQQGRSTEYVAPETLLEETLVVEWESILQLKDIGVHDNFFDLGGHSLLATRIISRLRTVLDVNIPIPVLFEAPTVAALATWIETKGNNPDADEAFPLVAIPANADGSRTAPQSFAQQRLWFLSEVAAGSALYNIGGAAPFNEMVDLKALRKTLSELARRHESLRTTFASQDGEPVQIVAPPGAMPLEVIDLRDYQPDQRRAELQRIRQAENVKPFDLARGPVARFTLVVMEDFRQILVYSMHHIITDGWSMALFGRELRVLYTAYKRGAESPLPERDLQYADFSAWQRSWLQGEVLEQQVDYWRQNLTGVAHLDLPADRPRPAIPRYITGQVPLVIPSEVFLPLSQLAQKEESTVFMLLLAAFQYVLGQNAGQDDVVVGTPIANRTRSELEGIIGFFVNTLVMRADLSGQPSFRELLRRVRENCLTAYSHQDLPFERIVEELSPRRELNVHPLFQVLFVLQNTPTAGNADSQSQQAQEPDAPAGDGAEMSVFDMTLSLTEADGQLTGDLYYNRDLFDQETAERFKRHYEALLTYIADDADSPLSSSALISDEEFDFLLRLGLPEVEGETEYCIHTLFEESVDSNPDHPAVVFEGRSLSYAELDCKANQLAHYLINLGVTFGSTVGVCFERGPEVIISLLATLKAGCTYIPINPELPADRLGWMMEDSAASIILTRESLRSGIPGEETKVLCLDSKGNELDAQPATRPEGGATPGDLAYIIYTSGTTGRPKGVMVEHRSLCSTITSQIPLFGVDQESRVLSTIAPSFDASLGEFFRTLVSGATLYLAPREQLLPGPDLIRLLRNKKITITTLVPSVLAAMPDDELPDLTTLTVGGEALPTELAVRWGKGRKLLNGYGPTEATIGVTLATKWPLGETPPLGYPLPHVHAYILGPDMELLPDGISGELYLGGPGLARGYLNQPDMTAKSFVDNPFSDESDARLYRTGDRIRWREDGQLAFLGRMDEQVKVRGYRIEPGEISAVLEQYSGISEAVVIARQDHTGGQRLVAYVVVDEGSGDKSAEQALMNEWQRGSDAMMASMNDSVDPRLHFTGYSSSYTGDVIPTAEMEGWADDAVERIRCLQPEHILEVGSGSGLMLFRLISHCEYYTAVDFSAKALEKTASYIENIEDISCEIDLKQCGADAIEGVADESVDTVVMNSVAQCFPNMAYFLKVLDGVLPFIRSGGSLFLGGLRNLQLLDTFHVSVQYAKATPTLTGDRLLQRAKRSASQERELLLDPQLFAKLLAEWARITRVQVLPKSGSAHHELNTFSYDVVLHLDTEPVAVVEADWVDWHWDSPEDGLADLRKILAGKPDSLGVRTVPNGRTSDEVALMKLLQTELSDGEEKKTIADLRQLVALAPKGVEPVALAQLAQEFGYKSELSWLSADTNGSFDVVFVPLDDDVEVLFPLPDTVSRDWSSFSNNPAAAAKNRNLSTELRDYLGTRLPDYMVPSVFMTLDVLPLTPHGKLDRNALPNPEGEARMDSEVEYVAPTNEMEAVLAGIWADLLRVDRVGINENFYDIGGHSLLATQVVSSIRSKLQFEVPIAIMFSAPTVKKLAIWIDENPQQTVTNNIPPLVGSGRDPSGGLEAPQSFAQQRLWFLSQLASGSALYNSLGAIPLDGVLDLDALEESLVELSRRHQALRTTFISRDGEPVQVVSPLTTVDFKVEDLRDLPASDRGDQLQRLRQAESRQPFDLENGPIVRYTLVIMDDARQLMMITIHHIATDGWSMSVLRRELRALYEAFREGAPSPLAEPILQYADFSEWQRGWLQGEVLEQQLEYWRQQLDGAEHLDIPTDRPRSVNPRYRGSQIHFDVPPRMARRLSQLALQEESTMFMLLLSAFQFILGQNAGQEDVVVGTPIANRTRAELEGIIGFFVNTLVMRVDLSGKPSFRELLHRVREYCLGAYSHQDLPFERLVEELAPKRELNMQPLFQILFSLENTAGTENQQKKTQSGSADAGGMMYFDLSLTMTEGPGGLRGELHYNVDLFDLDTAERLKRHYVALLAHVAQDPDAPLSSLFLISDEEYDYLRRLALPVEEDDSEYCIHHLFEESVDSDPDHTAVVFEGSSMSYGELDRKANQLAHYLISQGISPGSTVGVCFERGPEVIVSLLATLKAGGAYIPINPEFPADRLAWVLEDSAANVILTRESLRSSISGKGIKVLTFDALESELNAQPVTRPDGEASPRDLAYIIYTSGTTGRPKGVMIEHHSLCSTITSQIPLFGVNQESRVLSTVAPSFDASLGEYFRTLVSGATLFLAPKEKLLPGPDLIHLLRDQTITITTLVPSILAAMPDEALPDLTTLTVGGEALPAELAVRWGKGRKLLNGYGPTETTIGATLATEWPLGETPPLGYPLPHVHAYILGPDMELVPDGVPGELYLGGPGLARGYLNQPDLTAKAFLDDPFSEEPGARLYRTGDRVRWREDVQLAFLGRMDEQVKIRGYRIEPGEISSVLEQYSGLSEAVVVACPDQKNGQRLVAYVVPRKNEGLQSSEEEPADQLLLNEWQRSSDAMIASMEAGSDPRVTFTGYNSSYTGARIPQAEMEAWVDATVSRIRSLKPKVVLDIGSGSGQTLLRLASHCKSYTGIDFSSKALEKSSLSLKLLENCMCNVDLKQLRADELGSFSDRSFDTVIINSVAQYFPNMDYFMKVMEGALPLVRTGGALFLGGLRNLQLLDMFHSSVQFAKASPTVSADRLLQRANRSASQERELLLDPQLFAKMHAEWPRVTRVQVLPKSGLDHNELNAFYYDVVLHLDSVSAYEGTEVEWMDWHWETLDKGINTLREVLGGESKSLGVRSVPNARTVSEALLMDLLHAEVPEGEEQQTVEGLRQHLAQAPEGVLPERLAIMAEELGYRCDTSWLSGGKNGRFDVIFTPLTDADEAMFPMPAMETRDWNTFSNNPAAAVKNRNLGSELRDYLATRLPDYMVPSVFMSMEELPLTPHGKLDRRALPDPEGEARIESGVEYVAPTNDVETALADIWTELLPVDRVGINDNFFELGGDSILSIRVIARAAKANIVLTPLQMYKNQTVAEQAVVAILEDINKGDNL